MSEQVERRLVRMLPEHTTSPYGNPIPGLDELLGETEVDEFREGLSSLTEVVDGSMAGPFVVRRLGEPVQVDEAALPLLTLAKVRPGARVVVRDDEDDRVVVVLEGAQESEGVSLPRDVASHVFVQPAEPLTIS